MAPEKSFSKHLSKIREHLRLAEEAIIAMKKQQLRGLDAALLQQLVKRSRELRDDTIRAAARTTPKKEIAVWFNMTPGRISQICQAQSMEEKTVEEHRENSAFDDS